MWRKKSLTIAIVALCALILTSGAQAKTIYVDDDAPPGGDGTSWATAYRFLRDGLTQATDGDKVRVGRGVYKPDRRAVWPEEGDGDREASFVVPEGVVLRGGYAGFGAAEPNAWDADLYETILSGDLAGDDAAIDDPSLFRDDVSREDNSLNVVTTGPATVLEGLVITGGHACSGRGSPDVVPARGFNGAGIWIEADDVTVRNCRLHQNFAEQGGGGILCNEAEGVVLEQCIFEGNGVYGVVGGGGLCAWRSSATVEACLFSNNWARYWGGGMNVDDSEIVVSTSILRANRSDYDGGGVYVDIGSIQIVGCQVNYNRSGRHGGGVAVTIGSSAEITQCVFTGNASQYGGAISCSSSRNFVLLNSGVYGNMAEVYGGALRLSTLQSSVVANCTFADNRAFSGSFLEVLRQLDPPLGVSNCIVANGGQEIYSYEASTIFKHTAADGDSSLNCDPEGIEWGQGNISVDPCFVDPGYWNPNGTADDPNDDFYVSGDYHLKSQAGRWDAASGSWVQDEVTSPCIDAGDPNSPIMYEPFPNGGIINMGAYGGTAEASKSYFGGPVCRTIITGDINGDCRVDINDLILLIDHWTDE